MRINYFDHPITKRFIDAFPKFKAEEGEDTTKVKYFWETWQSSPFYTNTLTEDDLSKIYYHLLAKYYNWHFVYMDDLGIALNVMHNIEEFYPNVKERLKIVDQLRAMTVEEFEKSGMQINSSGSNPKIATAMDELINLVDSQNANFQLKSKEQTLRAKFNSLYDGVMEDFVNRFQYMFVKLYSGVNDYIYQNPISEFEDS